MPYKCVHCTKIYNDGDEEILKGCSRCGRKFFFYIRMEQLEKMKEIEETDIELAPSEKRQIEHDVREIVGFENEETPIFLDFESVRVIKPGKYAVDLGNLFSLQKPRVYKLEDGKYIVDLASVVKRGQGQT